MIGQTVSHYRIIERLGGGGMGVVYKAEDLTLHRTVALKFLPPALTLDPEAQERFIHEARAASALDHPSICTIHDVGQTDDGQTFLVMACYEGETLKEKIKASLEDGGLKIEDCIDFAIQVAEGLSRAHETGIVHRDIKPANIFVTTHGEVKILDFGLAKLAGQSMLTKSGTTLGTAAYMSPEQARGETADQRSDIWSLGIVMYEMCTGHLPFTSDYEQALVYAILNETPKPLRQVRPEIPEALEQIVQKALAKYPQERYQTAEELLSDLKITGGTTETGGTIAAAEAFQRKKRKRLVKQAIISAAAVVVVLLALFVVWPAVQEQLLASSPRTIAVISFENQTGDTSEDHLRLVLQDAIITSLEQSKYIRVTPLQRMRDILKQMGKKDVEFVDNELGLEICRREGVQLMAVGAFSKAGDLYKTTLKLVDVKTLETAKTYVTSAKGAESLLEKQIDDLSREVSRGIGVSERKTEETIRPVAEISTASPEAYRLYIRGSQEFERLNWAEARRYLEMALQKDSLFAHAWYILGAVYHNLGDEKADNNANKRAASLAWRASERERWDIAIGDSSLRAALGYPGVSVNYFVEVCAKRFPRDKDFLFNWGTTLLYHLGRRDEGISVLQKVLELDPEYAIALGQLAYAYNARGEWATAMEMVKRYAAASPGDPNPYDDMGNMYMSKGMVDEAIACYKQALAVSPSWVISANMIESSFFNREDYRSALQWADTAAARAKDLKMQAQQIFDRASFALWLGQLDEAKKFLAKREAMLTRAGQEDFERLGDFLTIWISCELGQFARSRRALQSWGAWFEKDEEPEFRRIPALTIQLCSGFINIKEGRMDSAAACLARMDSIRAQIPPSDTTRTARTIIGFYRGYKGLLKSEWLLATGNSQEALAARPRTRPSHLASRPYNAWTSDQIHRANPIIPIMVDIVPRAFLAMGQLDSSIAAYERAVEIPGSIFPRYHYRLAQVYERKGLKAKAIAEYQKFLAIWGKADPGYREPADARTRLAKLKRG